MTRPTALALAWSIGILVGCSIPGQALPRPPMLSFDKVVHIVMFLGFGMLWLRAVPDRLRAIVLAAVVFGVGIEVWQQIPFIGRSADPFDALADGLGAVLGVTFETARARRARRREQRTGA